jgi:hypothetical protein
MTSGTVDMRSRWRALVERVLPWFDPVVEARRNERTERIRRDAIAARMRAEEVREAYRRSARRTQR